MNLRQLEYFVCVAELGSFTRAALALDIAQPALSRQVRLLEVQLRQTLLLRNGRGVTLTEAGALLLEHGRGILHQMARVQDALADVRGGVAGRVALGLPPTVARAWAVPLVHAFRKRLPQVQLSIAEGLSVSMQEALDKGRLDLAVLYNARPCAEWELAPLLREELVLVQTRPPGLAEEPLLPLPLAALAQVPLIIPSRPNAMRMQVESALAECALRPCVAWEIDGVRAILDLVADGLGSAVLTRHAVASSVLPSSYTQRSLGPQGLYVQSWLATSARRAPTRAQQAAVALLREVLGANLGKR